MLRKSWLLVTCLGSLGMLVSGCGKSSADPNAVADNNSSGAPAASQDQASDSLDGPTIPVQNVSIERQIDSTPAQNASADPNSPSGQLGEETEIMEFDEESDFEDGIKDLAEETEESPELNPQEGSPEWYVREIVKLHAEPLPETDKVEEIRKEQIDRNRKVVSLARKAIEKAHENPEKARVFDVAVHRMIDSQAALALLGDPEGTDSLYDTAKSLFERDPKSKVALDASFTLVNVAFTNAHKTAGRDNRWVKEYARLSRQFVKNFPEDQRGISMLYNAALGCEWNDLISDASKTYLTLAEKFPDSPQAKLVPGVERRFKLIGEPLSLKGPSLEDGKTVQFSPEPGQVAVVLFWSADSEECRRVLPIVYKLAEKEKSLRVLGVCVDSDPAKPEALLKELGIDWLNIFYSEKEASGWNNPLVKHYGIMDVSAWLVSDDGTVKSTSVSLGSLEQHLSSLLKRDASREK